MIVTSRNTRLRCGKIILGYSKTLGTGIWHTLFQESAFSHTGLFCILPFHFPVLSQNVQKISSLAIIVLDETAWNLKVAGNLQMLKFTQHGDGQVLMFILGIFHS